MAKKSSNSNTQTFSGKNTSYKMYMDIGSVFMPTPNKNNPYTYIDTIKEFHSDIWASAEALVNQLNGSFTMSAEDRRDAAINFLRSTAAQWQSNELAFLTNELNKL